MDEEEVIDTSPQGSQRPRLRVTSHAQRPPSRDLHTYSQGVDSNSLLGQFSFAPATQTTVVTTTTTTMTKFPPFLMRPPRRMQELDIKQYPLAASPTPASLKKIHFEIGGKQTIFHETEDTTLALEQVWCFDDD